VGESKGLLRLGQNPERGGIARLAEVTKKASRGLPRILPQIGFHINSLELLAQVHFQVTKVTTFLTSLIHSLKESRK
jgi:hypothetical protein